VNATLSISEAGFCRYQLSNCESLLTAASGPNAVWMVTSRRSGCRILRVLERASGELRAGLKGCDKVPMSDHQEFRHAGRGTQY
jgi:hypothetical protein